MIRVFELFCKLNFINISAKDLFLQAMTHLNLSEHICPFCRTKHPEWKKHAEYERYLISYESGCVISYRINIIRYRCSSCRHTHAILPEFIIPYQCYSFLFITAAMRDYFAGALTKEQICEKYSISVSTLYAWKKLFLRQKKLWLGLLDDACTSSMEFLGSLIFTGRLGELKVFFLTAGISFLQGASRMKKADCAPT